MNKLLSSLKSPETAQLERFEDIISRNAATEFGVEHSLGSIRGIDDYRKAVPIKDYTGFKPYIDQMLKGRENVLVSEKVDMFGVTSGSTADPKFIPVTRSFTHEYHDSHLIWMYNMLKDRDDSVIGSTFSMVSPAEEGKTPGGTPYGSSSGKQYRDQSIPVRAMHPLPYSVFLIDNLEAKYHVALVLALCCDLKSVNSVNPSTLVMIGNILASKGEQFAEDIHQGRFVNAPDFDLSLRKELESRLKPQPKRAEYLRKIIRSEGALTPSAVWQNLVAINTWQGGNAPFYLSKLKELWGDAPQRCLGLRATEGMFSIPLSDYSPSGLLAINGHFMEFIEDGVDVSEDTETLLAHQLEVGKRYRMVITTSSGLYRYDLGDIVEVTGMRENTPEIAFLHKAGGVLSVTGEKVYEDQVVSAVSRITRRQGYSVKGFSVTVEMADKVRYVLIVELEARQSEETLQELIDAFDSELACENIEYRDKRKSLRLQRPVLITLESGAYEKYRAALVAQGRPDGQIKPPHILKPQKEGRVSEQTSDFFRVAAIASRVE